MNQYAPQTPLSQEQIEALWRDKKPSYCSLNEFTQLVRGVEARLGVLERSRELDVTGAPKLELNVLERHCIETLNTIKAWLDGASNAPFPFEAQQGIELCLMLASARRIGVR